jgi:outer membrane murein-binding lipoprotein Lpp
MSEDDKPPMPKQPTTVALERPPDWAIALSERVAAGFEKVDSLSDNVDTLSTSMETLTHDAKDTRLRLGRMERELDEVKDRQTSQSIRAKEPSQHDLALAAADSQEIVARKALAQKVDELDAKVDAHAVELAANTAVTREVKTAVTGWLKEHPAIGAALAGLIVSAITWATQWLHGGH